MPQTATDHRKGTIIYYLSSPVINAGTTILNIHFWNVVKIKEPQHNDLSEYSFIKWKFDSSRYFYFGEIHMIRVN